MRLTNEIRDKILEKLVSKAFPDQKKKDLMKELGTLISEQPLIQERKKVYDEYPEYVFTSDYAVVKMKDQNDYLRSAIQLPIKYATKISARWADLTFNYEELEDGELKEKIFELLSYNKECDEFKNRTKYLLYSVSSSTKLLELLPEAKEFLPVEEKKTVVNMSNVEFIRNCLSKGV